MKGLLTFGSLITAGFFTYANQSIAESVKYEIVGTVSEIAGPLEGGLIAIGDSVVGHYFVELVPSFNSSTNAWYDTTDLSLTVGHNYLVTASTGAIQVDLNNTQNISFHFTSLGNGLTGALISDQWTPDYFHQHVWRPLDSTELPEVIYSEGDPVDLRSQLRFNIDDSVQISFTLDRIAVIEDTPEPVLPNVYYGLAALGDINDNGLPEVAYLRTVSSGNIHVLIRDAISRDYIKTISFLSASYEPLDISVLPDVNGNGAQEIAVLALQTHTGDSRTMIKDALTGETLSEFNFSP